MMKMSDWINIPKDIEPYQGFVYCITNLTNDKKYIGKKFFWRIKKLQPLKGKINKRHFKVESDWKDYYGSSPKLHEDIDKYGVDCFERRILRLCKNKWDCAYYELVEQINQSVLFKDEYYNEVVNVRLRKRPNLKNGEKIRKGV